MNRKNKLGYLILLILIMWSCEKEARNIADSSTPVEPTPVEEVVITPTNINEEGFDFLEKMQGHWSGYMKIIADEFDWFAFDYRAISASQIHGIFEGGTLGNLFTSFFVTDFKGSRTIMARNGGLLNGIYRTSYFVMDSVSHDHDGDFYRFVDAEGGMNTMWMELRFVEDSLYFNAYTSRLGLNFPPTRHMTFKAVNHDRSLAETAAAQFGFPENTPAWDFDNGFMEEYLYAEPGARSATFLSFDESASKDVFTLAAESGDPWTIDQQPALGYLQVNIEINPLIEGKPLWLYLSKLPLTDELGFLSTDEAAYNSILLFPTLEGGEDSFLITYLHPGDYYITIIADNGDGDLQGGDYSHAQQKVTIEWEGQHQITISDITVEN